MPEDTTVVGWSCLFVLGIVLGSALSAWLGGEWSIVKPKMSMLVKTIVGSALMGFGAMWGQGCIIGNGLVGTATLSVKAWYALFFILLGIWTCSRIFLKKGKL